MKAAIPIRLLFLASLLVACGSYAAYQRSGGPDTLTIVLENRNFEDANVKIYRSGGAQLKRVFLTGFARRTEVTVRNPRHPIYFEVSFIGKRGVHRSDEIFASPGQVVLFVIESNINLSHPSITQQRGPRSKGG